MIARDYFSWAQGAFYFAGAWWTIQNVNQILTPTRLRVYKSLDRITWTAQDVANEPLPWFGSTSVCWDGDYHTDGKIHCIYCDNAGSLVWNLVEFDMLTGTWGVPHDPVNLVFNVFLPRVHHILFSPSTGDVFILYHNGHFGWPPDPDLGVKYAFLVGGIWTTDIFIDPERQAGQSASQALLDPNGTTVHYIFITASFGGPETPGRYVRIDIGGAVSNSANFMLFNGAGFAAGYAYFSGHSLIDPVTDSILIPWAEPIAPLVGPDRMPSVFVGTPLAAPIWANENVDPDEMRAAPALFLGFAGVPAPPAPAPVMANQGFRRTDILIPNHFDQCLGQDLLLHREAGPRKACCRDLIYYDIINVRAPAASIPFRKVAAIPTPLPGPDSVVLDFQVPTGYDGLLTGCFNVYTGPGFGEGNGDIEWRILINKCYAVQLGQILVTLGSRAQAYPIDGGIQIQSGQRIRYLVSVPNGSGGILPVNSQIVCGLEGLFYARQ
jgi:hypothetical protein